MGGQVPGLELREVKLDCSMELRSEQRILLTSVGLAPPGSVSPNWGSANPSSISGALLFNFVGAMLFNLAARLTRFSRRFVVGKWSFMHERASGESRGESRGNRCRRLPNFCSLEIIVSDDHGV